MNQAAAARLAYQDKRRREIEELEAKIRATETAMMQQRLQKSNEADGQE
jgi:hypothetical protein